MSGKPLPLDPNKSRYPKGRKARICRNCGLLLRYGTNIPRSGDIPPMNCRNCDFEMEVTIVYNFTENRQSIWRDMRNQDANDHQ